MKDEVIELLSVHSNEHYIDATLGAGGYTEAILSLNGPKGTVLAFELDTESIRHAQDKFAPLGKRFLVQRSNFRHMKDIVDSMQFHDISGIVFDFGLSMDLIKSSGRGFSFMEEAPLDMRFDTTQELDADTIINYWSEKEIADTLFTLGEERYSRRIAKNICEDRKKIPIHTTSALVAQIERSVPAPYRHRRVHCATKTFQALRMAVNDELGAIQEGVEAAFAVLKPGGRIVTVTFHSHEDRIIKNLFRNWKKNDYATLITKKPLVPTDEECAKNPASRSAKLRCIQKT